MKTLILTVAVALLANTAAAEDRQLLWGDTHLHTAYSGDAFVNNNLTATPDTAYRWAKGMPVLHPLDGARVKIETPLDFLVVSDHAEFLGVVRHAALEGPDTSGVGIIDSAKAWIATWVVRNALEDGDGMKLFVPLLPEPFDDIVEAAKVWAPSAGWLPASPTVEADTWKNITETADAYNAPGEFTALIGWEFSSIPGGANLHRVVLADIDAPTAQTFQPFGITSSVYPQDLWAWLETTSTETGGNFIAIPHNSNISKGAMFDTKTLRGEPITAEYAEIRRRWEPIAEITQIKGDSETHPDLSPADAFADFETYPYYIQRIQEPYKAQVGDYLRSGLKRGLELEQGIGINPYQLGVIGSTDAHTGLSSAEENNFQGKMATDSKPANKSGLFDLEEGFPFGWAMSASGLAAVWAEDNTRESIVAAMRRREVYASTGPRIGVRFYGGWGLIDEDLAAAEFPRNLFDRAVPMGGELLHAEAGAPTFLIEATADPMTANLDRVQVVKGWVDNDGRSYEKVFDVAWGGEGRVNADGSLAPVGNTVNLETGRYDNTIGAARLTTNWSDPEFNPAERAFYYVRVLQIPTPRHSLYDKIALGGDVDTQRPDVIQERAYTSSIWYSP